MGSQRLVSGGFVRVDLGTRFHVILHERNQRGPVSGFHYLCRDLVRL